MRVLTWAGSSSSALGGGGGGGGRGGGRAVAVAWGGRAVVARAWRAGAGRRRAVGGGRRRREEVGWVRAARRAPVEVLLGVGVAGEGHEGRADLEQAVDGLAVDGDGLEPRCERVLVLL